MGAALLGEGAFALIADNLVISLEIAAFHGIGAAAGREEPRVQRVADDIGAGGVLGEGAGALITNSLVISRKIAAVQVVGADAAGIIPGVRTPLHCCCPRSG